MARQEKCGGDKLPSPNTDRRPPTLCYEYAFSVVVVMCHVAGCRSCISLVERVGRRLIRLKTHESPTISWPFGPLD